MKVKVANLGPLRQAELELGDITIICGLNNTGKTYATYATYGFLDFWRDGFQIEIQNEVFRELMDKGSISLSLSCYEQSAGKYLRDAAKQYSRMLPRVFAARDTLFKDARFSIEVGAFSNLRSQEINLRAGSMEKSILQISKAKGADELLISLMVDKDSGRMPSRLFGEHVISDAIKDVVFSPKLPRAFIASAERTGSAIFQKELDFTRNRIIELLGEKSKKIHPLNLLGKFSGDYPIPVRKNVDFIRDLPNIFNRESVLAKKFPEVLAAFSDIIGGEYRISKDSEVEFIPTFAKRAKLTLVESSSAVRSLLDIGFYLRHIARPGELLMVDEPELNLHPENQRRVARLFARLVNLGVKVFVTTHSDYIIKEVNTLIMLNQKKPHLREIAQKEGYCEGELLSADKVKVYMAKPALIRIQGKTRRSRCLTLVPADVDPELGIEARTFDNTIHEMNRIQEEIIWGE